MLSDTIKIERVKVEDFEKILPLLFLVDKNLPEEKWKKIFNRNFSCDETYFGFTLHDQNEIVGFLGTIFSRREIDGKTQKFCNLSSLVVRPTHRWHALRLLGALRDLDEYTLTSFSSTRPTYTLFKRIGFVDFDLSYQLIPAVYPFPRKNTEMVLIDDPGQLSQELSGRDLEILKEHQALPSLHVLLKGQREQCYIVLTKQIKKGLSLGMIHYVSNKEFLRSCFHKASALISRRHGFLGLLLFKDYMSLKAAGVITFKARSHGQYKTKNVSKESLDSLYSEFFVLA